MPSSTTLLIVDAQNDFHPGGSLAIPTANDDAKRIAKLISEQGHKIDRIIATMDTHQKLHIAHPSFWLSPSGEHPPPFTIISSEDLKNGKWKPRPDFKIPPDNKKILVDPEVFSSYNNITDSNGNLDLGKYCIEYATQLEKKGRFQICVWPEHCLLGSEGHAVVPVIRDALSEWSEKTGGSVEWVLKGQTLLTEMYSALEADVPVNKETSFNEELQESIRISGALLVCGQAMSHCVNYTLRDIVSRLDSRQIPNVTLLTDCASAVPGFEESAKDFMNDMESAGVQLKLSTTLQL